MRPSVSIASHPDGSASGSAFAGLADAVSVLVMLPCYAPAELAANIPSVAETGEDITLNSDSETVSLRDWIAGHVGHVDEGVHELRQAVARLEKMVTEMHAELETARPLLEKWTHSKLVKLAAGQFPWAQNATGGNHGSGA